MEYYYHDEPLKSFIQRITHFDKQLGSGPNRQSYLYFQIIKTQCCSDFLVFVIDIL